MLKNRLKRTRVILLVLLVCNFLAVLLTDIGLTPLVEHMDKSEHAIIQTLGILIVVLCAVFYILIFFTSIAALTILIISFFKTEGTSEAIVLKSGNPLSYIKGLLNENFCTIYWRWTGTLFYTTAIAILFLFCEHSPFYNLGMYIVSGWGKAALAALAVFGLIGCYFKFIITNEKLSKYVIRFFCACGIIVFAWFLVRLGIAFFNEHQLNPISTSDLINLCLYIISIIIAGLIAYTVFIGLKKLIKKIASTSFGKSIIEIFQKIEQFSCLMVIKKE